MDNSIKDDGDLRKYYIQIPNLVDDTEMSVHAFRLYVHLKRVTGDNGTCWQSSRTLAKHCNMSLGMTTKAKEELKELGLITIRSVKDKKGEHHEITIVDIWPENMNKYGCSLHEQVGGSQDERQEGGACSPGETKNNPIKNNLLEEDNNNGIYTELSVAFVNKTKIPELSPNPRRWFEALKKMGEAGVEPKDIENAVDILWERDYTIVGLSSVVNTAINEMSKRLGKKPDSDSEEARSKYVSGEYADFIEH